MNTPGIMKRIGERIRDRRRSQGLSVEEIAFRSRTNVEYIKELEWAMMMDIDVKTLQLIAHAINVSMSELVLELPMSELRKNRLKLTPVVSDTYGQN